MTAVGCHRVLNRYVRYLFSGLPAGLALVEKGADPLLRFRAFPALDQRRDGVIDHGIVQAWSKVPGQFLGRSNRPRARS